ncbi:MAG: ATP-binding cassette domain-containing protein [Desulfobacteraceae bacterium]|nr:ATP-binding cassette domain-containing protein [Desulfobacteraceae bacterium]
MPEKEVLLQVKNIKKHYPITKGFLRREMGKVKAVDGVDFRIGRGETLGLVGESGCGKSTLGRVILGLEPPTEGSVIFDGQDLSGIGGEKMQHFRRRMQIIFQDPYSSLNPRQTVGRTIGEGLVIHGIGTPDERKERVREIMEVVGLRPEHGNRYPHEFSGGQRQRIGVARALALHPELVICDEPLSALDVSIQAQVINLLNDLQEDFHLTYLFISHDLSVVRHISDRVAVMYLGQLVELAQTEELFENPGHPYTRALLDAVPVADPRSAKKQRPLSREAPLPALGDSCIFRPRCPDATPECGKAVPGLVEWRPGHWVKCFERNPREQREAIVGKNAAGLLDVE